MNKVKFIALALSTYVGAHAGSIFLTDSDFTFQVDGVALTTGAYELRWGSVSNGVFTPFLGFAAHEDNGGYIDVESPELLAALNQGDNTVIASGSFIALSLSILADDSNYQLANGVNQIVLTDTSWLAPVFTLLGPELTFSFTENTIVAPVNGAFAGTSFNYNGGNEIINIVTSAIPEPSTFAAVAGLAVLGAVAARRRRSA